MKIPLQTHCCLVLLLYIFPILLYGVFFLQIAINTNYIVAL